MILQSCTEERNSMVGKCLGVNMLSTMGSCSIQRSTYRPRLHRLRHLRVLDYVELRCGIICISLLAAVVASLGESASFPDEF